MVKGLLVLPKPLGLLLVGFKLCYPAADRINRFSVLPDGILG